MERVLNRVWLKPFALLICLLALTQTSQATTVVIPPDDDMIIGARAIVRGKVVSIESSLDQQHNRIYTYITVKVREVIKGQITERKIVLKELGGQVGDQIQIIYGNPRFKIDEKVLLYLDTWADGSLRTYQMFLGKFDIVEDPKTGEEMAVRSSPDENTTVLKPEFHGHAAHGQSTERMELSSYVRMVRDRLTVNWDRSNQFEAEAYAGIPVRVSPAEYGSLKGSGDFHTDYAFLGNLRFFEPDSGQPVVVTLNPNPSSAPGVPQLVLNSADIIAAANAWSNVTGSNLRMSYSGPLTTCYNETVLPGVHIVSNNCDGRNSPTPGCASILAWGGSSRTGSQTRVIGGVTFRQVTQGFVTMNPWASCHFANSCNVQEILTHEIGHAIGLGHSQFNDATMAPFAHFDNRCASIRTDDGDGIRAIYPGSGGGPGPLTITTSALASGTVNQSYSQTLLATGGTTPYSWSLDAGSGPLPPGLSLNASNGAITGTPNTAGTYNFTVKVTDAASATATKPLSIAVGQSSGQPYSAQFVSQTGVPTTLNPGQTFTVNLRFANNGTQTWSGTSLFYLATQNPALNQVWGGNGVDLNYWGFLPIAPGQMLDLDLQFNAPTTPGTYNFQWQMYRNDGTTNFFGQMSQNVAIQVGTSTPVDAATFVQQSVPATMTAGQIVSVSVTMRNTGTTTWSAGTYFLGSQNPANNTTWGLSQVNLPSSVAPNAEVTFTFNVTAPATAGARNFQWQMKNGSTFFGAASTNVSVNVQSSARPHTIGLHRASSMMFYLRNSNTPGFPDISMPFGAPGDVAIVGDWDGNGTTTVGVFRASNNTFYLRNSNTLGFADLIIPYGAPGDVAIVGDWDGNGTWTIGVYRPSNSTFYLRNSNTMGFADLSIPYGAVGDQPLVGDWDGNGTMTIGVYRPNSAVFYLRNSNTIGFPDITVAYGAVGDTPVVGDWDGNRTWTIGIFRGSTSTFYLRNTNSLGFADLAIAFGAPGDIPLIGDWNGQ